MPAAAPPARAYRPRRFDGRPLLTPGDRHLVGRFSYGLSPALGAEVRKAGGAAAWFERQLEPDRVADPAGDDVDTWWPSLRRGPKELWTRNVEEVEGGWEVMQSLQRHALARRTVSRRQVHEVMTEFWQHLLNVPVHSDGSFTHRASYDRAVRQHALGSFADLLHATTTHPAMGIFLSNAVSTRKHPNENLGRELLELHTVGRGAYTEDDVKASARILTGWRVDLWRTWEATYSLEDHWTGPVQVIGFTDDNAPRTEAEGRALTRRYTDYLARHPSTAERVARRLAVKFVGDAPSEALVAMLARTYLRADTAVRPVLRALVASDEFRAARGSKVRDPAEDVVATYRALGVRIARPTQGDSAVNAMLWQAANLGAEPYAWPTPDGQPVDNRSWASPSRMLASLDLHYSMSGAWWPSKDVTYRTDRQWLPRRSLRFDLLVDHLSQQLLGRRSTSALLRACCESVDVTPATVMDAEHGVVKWNMHRVLATVLDSPAHLTR
ncbi:hypothetical protein ENKNEFLB_02262 [Nocardioides aquaticus]|uniref:DUF1800 domain-containing protein n=1 Tax=Nocardioides aquaticus TaxID=160826 RepID=A0ABX8EH73_9ACTN|nr:DUF1800 domain-containing protein [Nocardioides aquaticus]QVT79872.1 hypothetical protein ENKNEFLB_02262 [Nocardioides aquaticus]